MKGMINGMPVMVSEYVPKEYKETKITYHKQTNLTAKVKRWNYKIKHYIKREVKGHSMFVMGNQIIMNQYTFDKLVLSGELIKL